DPVIPNIIIAPVVACDAKGNRIGLGKGFYDITLQYLRKKNPNLLYIGLCFDFQLIERIESAKHDQKLDIIITESQVIPILTYN
ncbi:MAG: 5-formyltetrahydrofolate cyclo-ligase, partial [Pseudomonadota bacterium]